MSTHELDNFGNTTFTFNNAPQVTQDAEMDFNSFVFYKQTNQMTVIMSREEVWDIILHPNKQFEPGVVYKMMPANAVGPLIPAHFPSIADSVSLHKAFISLFAWHISNDLPQTLNTLIPTYLMHLIDPKPRIDLEQEPYSISSETETLKVKMASYVDGIQIVELPTFHNVLHLQVFTQLGDVIPSQHTVVIDPLSINYSPQIALLSPVPPRTILACWNVRDVARPLFIANFQALFDIYKPTFVVLLETRNSVHNLSEIVPRLPRNFTFSHSIMDSHSRGVVLLWRWRLVYCHARFRGQGQQPVFDLMAKDYPTAA